MNAWEINHYFIMLIVFMGSDLGKKLLPWVKSGHRNDDAPRIYGGGESKDVPFISSRGTSMSEHRKATMNLG